MYLLSGSLLDTGGKLPAALTGYYLHWRYWGTISCSIWGGFKFSCTHCVTFVTYNLCRGFSHGHRMGALNGFELAPVNKLRSLALKATGILCNSLCHEKAAHCVLETFFQCWEAWILYETSLKNQVKKKRAYIKLSNLCKEKKLLSAHSDLGACNNVIPFSCSLLAVWYFQHVFSLLGACKSCPMDRAENEISSLQPGQSSQSQHLQKGASVMGRRVFSVLTWTLQPQLAMHPCSHLIKPELQLVFSACQLWVGFLFVPRSIPELSSGLSALSVCLFDKTTCLSYKWESFNCP